MKKTTKRLALNGETIKTLATSRLHGVYGGVNSGTEGDCGGSGTYTATVNCPSVGCPPGSFTCTTATSAWGTTCPGTFTCPA